MTGVRRAIPTSGVAEPEKLAQATAQANPILVLPSVESPGGGLVQFGVGQDFQIRLSPFCLSGNLDILAKKMCHEVRTAIFPRSQKHVPFSVGEVR